MPHIQIDYSANLESEVDFSALCEHLRHAASGIAALPMAGLKVRAIPAPHYAIADGNPAHGYIDVSVRLRGGRSLDVRQAAVAELLAAAEAFLAPVMARRALALSFEMRDIDPDLAPKSGNIRDYL